MLGKDDESWSPRGNCTVHVWGKVLTAPYACVQSSHLIFYLPINPLTCPLSHVCFKASRASSQYYRFLLIFSSYLKTNKLNHTLLMLLTRQSGLDFCFGRVGKCCFSYQVNCAATDFPLSSNIFLLPSPDFDSWTLGIG